MLSPPAIAHDKFVSPGFAHKHRVASRLDAEDLERMRVSVRQHGTQAGKGLRKTPGLVHQGAVETFSGGLMYSPENTILETSRRRLDGND